MKSNNIFKQFYTLDLLKEFLKQSGMYWSGTVMTLGNCDQRKLDLEEFRKNQSNITLVLETEQPSSFWGNMGGDLVDYLTIHINDFSFFQDERTFFNNSTTDNSAEWRAFLYSKFGTEYIEELEKWIKREKLKAIHSHDATSRALEAKFFKEQTANDEKYKARLSALSEATKQIEELKSTSKISDSDLTC